MVRSRFFVGVSLLTAASLTVSSIAVARPLLPTLSADAARDRSMQRIDGRQEKRAQKRVEWERQYDGEQRSPSRSTPPSNQGQRALDRGPSSPKQGQRGPTYNAPPSNQGQRAPDRGPSSPKQVQRGPAYNAPAPRQEQRGPYRGSSSSNQGQGGPDRSAPPARQSYNSPDRGRSPPRRSVIVVRPVPPGPRFVAPPNRRHHYRDVWVVRPYGHWYSGYGYHYRDDDAYLWLAFTAITLSLLTLLTVAQQRAQEQAQIDATTAPVGSTIVWNDANASGSVSVLRDGHSSDGQYCREYQQTVTVGGRSEQAYGTACMQPDGAWHIVDAR